VKDIKPRPLCIDLRDKLNSILGTDQEWYIEDLLEVLPNQVDIFRKTRVAMDLSMYEYCNVPEADRKIKMYHPINFDGKNLKENLAKMIIHIKTYKDLFK
jgi:hypothetical protein